VIGGVILFIYSIILTFTPVIRTLNWNTLLKWEQWIAFVLWIVFSYIIHKTSCRFLPNRDPYLLPIIYLLTGIGIFTIFRLSIGFGWRQLIWFSISSLLLIFLLKYLSIISQLRRYKYIWLSIGLLITGLTFFFGIYPGGEGPRLWLGCCGIYFQPSEPLKLIFIIFLAAYFADNWALRKQLSILLPPSIVMVVAAILILFAQRDLGTATIFLILYTFFIFIVTGKIRTIFYFLAILILSGVIGYQRFDVIQIRINGWLNPWVDPTGGSYQIIQSLQAIAAGNLLGTGPGLGSPGIVPVAISDFIFSAISEELGLIGGLFIICLYTFLAYRGFSIAIKSRNQYQRLLASGITVFLSIQSVLIIGGNTRFLPLTGVTLPFISYGGSSLVTVFIAALFLLLISQNQSSKAVIQQEAKPYLLSYSAVVLCFLGIGLISSYWSIARSDSLLNRPDNLRKIINDRFVPRGNLLDRQNDPITITTGERGAFTRWLNEPSLSTTVGYNHPFLGQSGLEASMDSYLRGLAGIPSSEIWWNQLIYARPPDGLEIRTTIDLSRQKQIDNALKGFQGGALIMNAKTGEIQAIWSSPGFDANRLEEDWNELSIDQNAPLINRVSQGKYEIGNLVSLFYLGYLNEKSAEIQNEPFFENGKCAIPLSTLEKSNIQLSLMNGCENANATLNSLLNTNEKNELIQKYGWSESYNFELPTEPTLLMDQASTQPLESILISPLQIARAGAAFSNAGFIPYPRLTTAINTPHQNWLVLASKESIQILDRLSANQTATYFSRTNFPAWEMVSSNFSLEKPIHWYISGTLPDWQATPLVLVLTLESGSAEDAKLIGQSIMEQILTSGSQ
jgi:cell division protein FtsW (lipid II flippase)